MDWEEKRKHPRFRAADNALAARGEDAYTLMDLSAGGVGIRYKGEHQLPEEIHLDLFFLNRELAVTGVRCRKVFEVRMDGAEEDQAPEWHVGLQFQAPGAELVETLRQFRWTEN